MALSSSDHHLKPSGLRPALHALLAPVAGRGARAAANPAPERSGDGSRPPTSSPDRPLTAALSTPHDAVLADLQAPREATPKSRADASRGGPKLSVLASVGSLTRTERTASPSAGARSAASTPGIPHEPLLDPFSGSTVGVVVPKKGTDAPADAAQLDQRRDELWARLARIRELQGEVAGMHVQMEGIGLSDARGGKRAPGAVGRVHSDTIPGAEEWGEPEGAPGDAAEEQRKRARDAEFTNLAETFQGRRESIDAIMNKVCAHCILTLLLGLG